MSEKKKIENPGLLWAIEQLRIQNSPQAQEQVSTELRKAVFLVPTHFQPIGEPSEPDEKGERKMQAQVRLLMITSKQDDSKIIPLFTDEEQKNKGELAGEKKPFYMPMRLMDVAQIIVKDDRISGVVINPYGVSVRLDRKQIAKVLADLQPKKVQIRISNLKEMPQGMVQRLTDALRKQPHVERAWLRYMEQGDEKGSLCVVKGENIRQQVLFPLLGEIAKPYPMDMRFFAARYDGAFGAKATENSLPFYERDAQVM